MQGIGLLVSSNLWKQALPHDRHKQVILVKKKIPKIDDPFSECESEGEAHATTKKSYRITEMMHCMEEMHGVENFKSEVEMVRATTLLYIFVLCTTVLNNMYCPTTDGEKDIKCSLTQILAHH